MNSIQYAAYANHSWTEEEKLACAILHFNKAWKSRSGRFPTQLHELAQHYEKVDELLSYSEFSDLVVKQIESMHSFVKTDDKCPRYSLEIYRAVLAITMQTGLQKTKHLTAHIVQQ